MTTTVRTNALSSGDDRTSKQADNTVVVDRFLASQLLEHVAGDEFVDTGTGLEDAVCCTSHRILLTCRLSMRAGVMSFCLTVRCCRNPSPNQSHVLETRTTQSRADDRCRIPKCKLSVGKEASDEKVAPIEVLFTRLECHGDRDKLKSTSLPNESASRAMYAMSSLLYTAA